MRGNNGPCFGGAVLPMAVVVLWMLGVAPPPAHAVGSIVTRENLHVWSVLCDDEAPVVGACPVPQVWVNMTDAMQVLPTVRNGKAFATRLPFRVPLGLMWVATTSSVNITRPTLDAAINASALDLYATGTGLLAVSPDAPWDADPYRWPGIVLCPLLSDEGPRAADDVQYKLTPDGRYLVVQVTRTPAACPGGGDTALCTTTVQGRVAVGGTHIVIVVKDMNLTTKAENTVTRTVGLALAMGFPSAASTTSPLPLRNVQGSLGAADNASTAHDEDALPLVGGVTFALEIKPSVVMHCAMLRTCSLCLMDSREVRCVWFPHFNGGTCLDADLSSSFVPYDGGLTAPSACREHADADDTPYGPCLSPSTRPRTCVAEAATAVEADVHATLAATNFTMYPNETLVQLTAKSYIADVVRRDAGSPLGGAMVRITASLIGAELRFVFDALTSNLTSAPASRRVLRLELPFRVEVSLHWGLRENVHSRFCTAPYKQAGGRCDVMVCTTDVRSLVGGVTTVRRGLVVYYLVGEVISFHWYADAMALPPLGFYSISVEAFTNNGVAVPLVYSSSLSFALPNRSFHFIPSYACLGACVHGTCDAEGVCHCSFPSLWDGPMCDVEVGTYAVQVNATYRTTVECPDCGAHGNCTDEGACRCDASHAGPRCELDCSARAHEGCDPTRSLGVCGSCSCFAGYVALPFCGTLQPGCNLSATTGALLPNASCATPTVSPLTQQERTGVTNLAVAVLAMAVTAVLGVMYLQRRLYLRKLRRYHGDADDAALRPLGGFALLLPGPRLVGSAPSP